MTTIFTVLLVGVLTGSLVYFVVMGLRRYGRSRALAAAAHRMNMRFNADDQLDMPRRYADFAAIGCGHSARAFNITHGRIAGWPVRMFDFCCELGHGTRRMLRKCNVATLEIDFEIPSVLLWSDLDVAWVPLSVRRCDGHVGSWSYHGDAGLAGALAVACEPLASVALSIETRGKVVMISAPAVRRGAAYIVPGPQILATLRSLGEIVLAEVRSAARPQLADGGAGELPRLDVANTGGP